MSLLNGSEPRVRAFADNTILLLAARVMAAFGPPIALAFLGYIFIHIQNIDQTMATSVERMDNNRAQILRLQGRTDIISEQQQELGNRVTRLEAKHGIQ